VGVKTHALAEALESLNYLVALDMEQLATQLDSRILDGLENGKAQKFEVTIELCWKAVKVALRQVEGIDESSPKKVIKAWYRAGHLSEDDFLNLIDAVDDRNRLSHAYDGAMFDKIIASLPRYAASCQRLLDSLEQPQG